VVDDDAAMREMVVSLLDDQGIHARAASSADDAIERLAEFDCDVVLSDIRMPGRTGIELLGQIRELRPDTPVVLMTAFGSIDSAVEAMHAGAFDYVTKPFQRDALLLTLERAFERRALEEENRRLRRAVDQTSSFGELIGNSPSMREIFALIRKIASNRSSVLISGESGTGKEVVARTIHFSGARAARTFVPINCTAIPEGLLESELFGHVRGAFTGAHVSKRGLFEQANGGTLFLDEIGDMGLGLQGKLLRVLQDREIRPVGGNTSVKVDVRIIAATHQNLETRVKEGLFREDLFHRLNVIRLRLPSLRERGEDIPILARHFLQKSAHDLGVEAKRFSDAALSHLASLDFPGNVRQLENICHWLTVMAPGQQVDLADLPAELRDSPQVSLGVDWESALAQEVDRLLAGNDGQVHEKLTNSFERVLINRALAHTGGRRIEAALALGIGRNTITRKIQELGLGAGRGNDAEHAPG